jgi:hypothetical protein
MKRATVFIMLAVLVLAISGCGQLFEKNNVQVPMYDNQGKPMLGANGQPLTITHQLSDEALFYQVQAEAEKGRKPILVLVARDGQDISFTGLERLEVWGPNGGGGAVKTYESQWAKALREWGGIFGALGGIYLGGQVAVDLANAVGQHAGHNVTVGGDYTRDGSIKYGGDVVGGDKAGRDGNWNSHNTTTTTNTTTSTDDPSTAPTTP